MGENNARLEQFVTWLSRTYFNEASPEQIVQEIQTMQGSEEGRAQLQQWAQEFQQATSAFKKDGKIDQLVERRKKIKKSAGGSKIEGDSDTRRKIVEERVENPDGTTGVRVKEFTISGPPERRDSIMSTWYEPNNNVLDAFGNALIRRTKYQTPYKASQLGLQPLWRRIFNILPPAISAEDMRQFDDMKPSKQ